MVVREGYKQTEVGVIPEDWKVRKLRDLSSMKSGNSITAKGIKDFGKYPCYGGNGLRGYTHNYTHKGEFALVGRQGALCGNVQYVEGAFFASEHAVVVEPYSETDIKWLSYVLKDMNLNQYSESSAQPGLSVNKILELKAMAPKVKAEQKAIATALADIDGLINSLSRLIEKKKNIKQGAMQELLTGKKRLEGFSGEWVLRTMGNLFKFSGGYSASREQLSTEGYSYLHYGDIHGTVKTFVDIKDEYLEMPKLNIGLNKISKDKLLQDGDVVFVDASEDDEGVSKHVVIRNTHGIPFISGLHTIVAKSRTNELHNLYKEYCFQSKEVKKQFAFYAVGIKVSGISRSNIIKIVLKIPPTIEEQTAIATILSDMDSEIENLQTKLDKYKAIKQGMMQELLTGRIRLLEGA